MHSFTLSNKIFCKLKYTHQMAPSYCVNENKECVKWVETYFKDCLCNLRDDISFSLGLMSLVSWGVAEIPQIITIFCTKSSHGVSLAFLLTWVAGFVNFSYIHTYYFFVSIHFMHLM
jgi:hypothetical protein